ncbi:hypothetical protein THAOC_26877 [Thalassiosira oceanica]|uniref:Uncharacterized protein n=1 Tax=Thalassiosira oceanica TaxID=159749 RepID=K0RN22_THAOC|nr:hypothetical protein THAOC_26877 [Thalassiosira oceanica]|eukprot:EJK53639.1 hypothetical protein THAOC_26877 [Thalassiosira oceanica]
MLCPHSAVGVSAIKQLDTVDSATVCLATAHFAKFGDACSMAVTPLPEIPKELSCLWSMKIRSSPCPNDAAVVQGFVEKRIEERIAKHEKRDSTRKIIQNMVLISAAVCCVYWARVTMDVSGLDNSLFFKRRDEVNDLLGSLRAVKLAVNQGTIDRAKQHRAEAAPGPDGDDNGPGSEPPPHGRFRYVSKFVTSRRRPPAAVGKPSFTYFPVDCLPHDVLRPDEPTDLREGDLPDATSYERSEDIGPKRRKQRIGAVYPASAKTDSFNIVLPSQQFWPVK